ncbi:MAG: hypothetical protein JW776_02720 [Candidatus Lokiarchaeota archaeon]|nr:hypothetical protein [Candidatus Lokiarchaeota archaeon]
MNDQGLVSQFDKPFFLLIYSTISRLTKLSIYPLEEHQLPVKKYLIQGSQITQDTVRTILFILNKVVSTVLHTSGILIENQEYYYELYLTNLHQETSNSLKNEILAVPGIDFLKATEILLHDESHHALSEN